MFDDLADLPPFTRIGMTLAREVAANRANYGDSFTCLRIKQEALQRAVFGILAELTKKEGNNV